MVTRKNLLTTSLERFADARVPVTSKELEWLLLEAASISLIDLVTDPAEEVSVAAAELFASFVERRLNREPVQYILGHAEFYGLRFAVNPSVLIPRPETEQLVERALEASGPRTRLLDIGTGSGCIAISFKKNCPECQVTAVDVSAEALSTARANGDLHECDIHWIKGDLFSVELIPALKATFWGGEVDLLVSNPPYVLQEEIGILDAEVVDHEPHIALFATEDALDGYRALSRMGHDLLTENGQLLVEIHADMGRQVKTVFADEGYQDIRLHSDLAGRDRIVEARI